MTISITNIVSLMNGVLWNRFMVATFSNIPCIWYWARFILAICQRSDRGPFVQRIHWLFKTWNAWLQNCRCAHVMLICFKIFGELEIFDAKHWSDWCRLEKDVIFKSGLLIDGCMQNIALAIIHFASRIRHLRICTLCAIWMLTELNCPPFELYWDGIS